MGSGTSKGIKVAPACVGEMNVSDRDADVCTQTQHSRPSEPLKTHKFTNATDPRNPARLDRHGEGRDSDVSAEDDDVDVDAEPDRVLAHYGDREKVSKVTNSAKKSFVRSKTYGLCNFRRVHADNDFYSTPQLPTSPRGPDSDSVDVNKKGNGVFSHFRKHSPPCPNNQLSGLVTRGHCMEPVAGSEKESSFGNCHSPSLAMPAIQYDGSEEELMDTIEREFS